jgi:gliding motility-associated-like protein/uncharacterized repeat protein (TIGR01451 family)
MKVNRFAFFISCFILTVAAFVNNSFAYTNPPSQSVAICQGTYAVLNASSTNAAAYQWYNNGQMISGATSKTYNTGVAGIYKVVAFNQQSCASDVSDEIQVVVNSFSSSITFNPLADKTFGDAPFKLTAESKKQITYTASPAGIVSIDSKTNMVTIIGVGDVIITATIPGKSTCGTDIMAQQTLKVKPQTQLKPTVLTNTPVDLAVVASSDSKQISTNQPFEYTLTVKNQSAGSASNVSVTDTLPAALNFIGINNSLDGKATYDPTSHSITWKIDQLKGNGYAELRFSALATRHGAIKNTVKVVAAEEDLNAKNNISVDYKDISGINIPNVFTPNGDGKNDTFTIADLDQYSESELVVVNRWGGSVYQAKNYRNTWTGDKLDDGTYFYSLKVKNSKGEQEEYKGYITLLRSAI